MNQVDFADHWRWYFVAAGKCSVYYRETQILVLVEQFKKNDD